MFTTYKTITTPTLAEFKDKGSRFIEYAYPIRKLADVKKY
ncbi:YigZ family protein, partial [Neisseria sp. P0006.S010]